MPATSRPAPDAAGRPVTYVASHLVDRKPGTAWRMDGDGTGSTLVFTFDRLVTFTSVGLVNGYAKVDPVDGTDRYPQMRRILRVTWTFDGASPVPQFLADGDHTPQSIPVAPVTARVVSLSIDATTLPGEAGFDWTPISEVYLTGR